MTLEFKFPENQTNLLALEGVIYKIKFSYESDCSSQNEALSKGACMDVIKSELEEALRAIVFMFMNTQPLRPVSTRHFKFYSNKKPWRASRKLKFRYNGEELKTSPDFLDINVWTKETPSPCLRDFANYSQTCNDLTAQLSVPNNNQYLHGGSSEIVIPPRRTRATSSPVVVDGRVTRRRVEVRKSRIGGSPLKRRKSSPVRKKSSTAKKRKVSLAKRKSSSYRKQTSRKRSRNLNFNNAAGQQLDVEAQTIDTKATEDNLSQSNSRKQRETIKPPVIDTCNTNSSAQTITGNNVECIENGKSSQSERRLYETRSLSASRRSKRPLLKKARLDQFVVQEQEMAEEQKLQQLAQPTRHSPRIKGKQPPLVRLSSSGLESALNMILTPFKLFSRSKTSKTHA